MRKIHLLMPTILVTSSMPMVSMVGCNNEKPEPAPQNLTFTALGEGFEINLFNDCYEIEEALIPELYYSIDNGKPIKYQIPPNDEGPTITIRKGSSISFWGNNPDGFSRFEGYEMRNLSLNIFRVYGKCDISGNIMSIIDNGKCRQTTIPGTGCFAHLFSFNDIRNANNLQLPATQLTSYCYESMFSGCDKLISIPELPATNLAENCYSGMFQGCRSLEIDSDWFVNNIFNRQNMIFDKGWSFAIFAETKNISEPFKLPDDHTYSLQPYCFSGLNAELPITDVQDNYLPWTNLAQGCYSDMFYECWNLEKAPQLPATTLVDSCYQNMFVRCQELKPSNDPDEGIKFFDCPTDCSDLSIDQMFRQATAEFWFDGTPTKGEAYYYHPTEC